MAINTNGTKEPSNGKKFGDTVLEIKKETEVKPPEVKLLEIDKLDGYKNHPFATYEGERLDKFAESIDTIGLQNPIIVRPVGDGRYEIINGHNRVKAMRLLKKQHIDAIIKNLSDAEAERVVIESNVNQQSFSEWKYSQQIKVIKLYSKYIKDNSKQGERNDINKKETETCVQNEHESMSNKKRLKSRDKIANSLGISATVFERYRRIAKLNDDVIDNLGLMLDEKRLGFMSAFRLSKLKPEELAIVLTVLNGKPEVKLKGTNVKSLCDESEKTESTLSENRIEELLLSANTEL
ncbi:MAG: ParB N-terminal domain-containing protein [Prevotella sp.]|jgi:ParB family chromosome partitioning protein|nr:ParB N-terminal domain-containing protein [Prevotella sp.]